MQQFVVGANADPVEDESRAREAFRAAAWWKQIGLEESWPLSTELAAKLLWDAGQYATTAERLLDMIERRIVPPPARGDEGEFEWNATDLVAAIQALEFRGDFHATPSVHDFKKPGAQLALEMARQDGVLEEALHTMTEQPVYDVPHILALLARAECRSDREKLVALLKGTLLVDFGVVLL